MNPIDEIADLHGQLKSRDLLAPMCLSTLGSNGVPNSRFVDLKEVAEGRLFFGTDERSTKAKEFSVNSGVSICAWWEEVQVQVRVIGFIEKASHTLSDKIFSSRNRTAKAIATISVQSGELADFQGLRVRIAEYIAEAGPEIVRPNTWWVYGIVPTEVEVLRFSEDRIHRRKRYRFENECWLENELSP